LRVVDASVFPKIPGHFIVSAVYMISEKALDVILEDAERMAATCAESVLAAPEGVADEPERVIAV
jgi:choline dehydrogenase-like flavoprotein